MKNIVLIGFMAVGKTTVGRMLSDKLNFKFIDTDEVIENKCNKTIQNIFAEFGEGYFRKIESDVVKIASSCTDTVISCGGGTPKDPDNVRSLEKNGMIICLKADADAICKRADISSGIRPILYNKSKNEIEDLMLKRQKYYDVAQYFVDTSDLTPEEVADMIIEYYRKETDFYVP
ncbi:MAG TPA: shikimate kinase [Clostridiaceae bacterium]|nr:shikimate kinase [Clostridiaceae bacterium]